LTLPQTTTRCARAIPGRARLAGLLALWLTIPAVAGADGFEQALQAAQRGDFAEAYCIWKPLAMRGHAPSQYHLGWMYANGEGLAVDEAQAVRWWRAAAEQGHLDAQMHLGMAYLYGEGVDNDRGQAVEWFYAVAKKGDEDAQALVRQLAADGDEAALALVKRLLQGGWEVLGGERRVRVERGNLRAGPGTGHKVVQVLGQGQTLMELARDGDWLRVGVPGSDLIAWAHASLVE